MISLMYILTIKILMYGTLMAIKCICIYFVHNFEDINTITICFYKHVRHKFSLVAAFLL